MDMLTRHGHAYTYKYMHVHMYMPGHTHARTQTHTDPHTLHYTPGPKMKPSACILANKDIAVFLSVSMVAAAM